MKTCKIQPTVVKSRGMTTMTPMITPIRKFFLDLLVLIITSKLIQDTRLFHENSTAIGFGNLLYANVCSKYSTRLQ